MIKYFKELLDTLKQIKDKIYSIERSVKNLEDCVNKDPHGHGKHISTGHWNTK